MSERENIPAAVSDQATADETRHRLGFLAAAGEVLASSLDVDQTLQDVARLAIRVLGDLCIVDVVEGGVLRRVATAHADTGKAALLEELRRLYPPSADSPQPTGRVLRSGEIELFETVTPAVVKAHTRDDNHRQIILAIGIRSYLSVPLIARGATLGVISFGITETDRTYGPADVALARDLARRAAIAIDNARLYQLAQEELSERRRVEGALRVSESRFRAIFEQSPLSTQILAPDGRTVRVNPAWQALWGSTMKDLGDYNILADPQLEAQGTAALLRCAFAGQPVHLPAIRYNPAEAIPGGSRDADPARWVSAFAYPVKNEAGAVAEVVLVHQDITGTRRSQEELRVSEERLRLALAAGHMNVWEWDLQTGMVQCSANAREFWGIAVGRIAEFTAVIHPDDRATVEQSVAAAIAGHEPYFAEYRIVRPDGELRWVQSRGQVDCDAEHRPMRILGITLDVTGLKSAQETTRLIADAGDMLGASLDYHATLQNLTRLLVPRLADWCAVDLLTESGTLERVAVSHPDPERLEIANEIFARFPPLQSDRHGAWQVIRTGQPEWAAEISDEMLELTAHDAEHAALLRQLRIRSAILVPLMARGATIGVLTLVHAESGRRYTEADVDLAMDLARRAAAAVDNARLYQQLRAEDRRKDEFLATLAHELRNPLAPIRTGLALLRVAPDAEAAERTRQVMERQLGHMVRLIDDLLDLSRVTRGTVQIDREPVDLRIVVGSAIEASRPLLDSEGVQLDVDLPHQPVVVEVDRTRMSQVLSNLLNNAAKFTPRGGRVELVVDDQDTGVQVRVSDTGIGIPQEMLGRIFDMFAQVGETASRSQSGLGIGLTLVRRLVELHGGTVRAESGGEGHGSTFVVALPRPQAWRERMDSPLQPLPDERPTSVRRVLVVDDNEDAAEMLAMLLSVYGHEVRTASGGAAALEIVETFRPHVAFLDIGMPGMSGYELGRRLRADSRFSGMRLVAVTGWGQDEDRRQSMESGFDHHLTKPVDPAEVQTLVVQYPDES